VVGGFEKCEHYISLPNARNLPAKIVHFTMH